MGEKILPEVDQPRIERAIREVLLAIGEDPERDGLADTPARVARLYGSTPPKTRASIAGVGASGSKASLGLVCSVAFTLALAGWPSA